MKRIILALSFLFLVVVHASDKEMYASLLGGYVINTIDNQTSYELDLDTTAYSVGAGLGYRFDKHWFVSAEYLQSHSQEVVMDNIYASINYQYPLNEDTISPYMGLLYGQSRLSWKEEPVITPRNEKRSDAPMFGIQMGVGFEVTPSIDIALSYQYIYAEHTTYVTTQTEDTRIVYNNFNRFLFSLQYSIDTEIH